MSAKRILVTGGTGFVGRYVINRLVKDGHDVYALVRDKKKLLKILGSEYVDHLKIIELQSPEKSTKADLKQLIEENEINTIIHIAASVGEHQISWNRYFEVNVLWTKNLALAFLKANVRHEHFIYTSSVGVYGTIPKKVPADENTPYNPDGNYHKSKVMAEKELLLLRSSSNLPLTILRPTILYGRADEGFLYKFFRLMKRKIFPLCGSNPHIHLLDVEFLAEIYAELVKSGDNSIDYIFNVGDGESISVYELTKFIKKSMDAGYFRVPSMLFSLFIKLSVFNMQRSISLKLVSKHWYYNVDKLFTNFNFERVKTVESLENKYLSWYKGRADDIG